MPTPADTLAAEVHPTDLARALLQLQTEGLRLLLERPDDPRAAAAGLCRLVGTLLPGRACAIATLDEEGRADILAAPDVPAARMPHLAAALQDGTLAPPVEEATAAGAPFVCRRQPISGIDQRPAGVLAVVCLSPQDSSEALTPEEALVLESSATLAGTMLEYARIHGLAELERDAASQALGRYADGLKAFSDLTAAYSPPHEQIRALLELGCRTLGAQSAALGEIQAGRYRLLTAYGERPAPLGPGETVALGPSLTAGLKRLAGEGPADPARDGQDMDAAALPELPPGSGLVALTVLRWSDADGHPHQGALSFSAEAEADPSDLGRRQIVDLVGQRIASSLRERAVLDGLLSARQKEVVGHLASGVAHDFNNLLGVVDLNLDYLRELLPRAELDPEVLEILEETRMATRHARVVTAGMLSLSRRQIAPPGAAALSDTVERFVHGLGRLLPPDIAVVTRIEPQVAALADPALLQSALLNLIINARDAMGGRGRLEIGLSRVELDAPRGLTLGALEAGEYAQLEVTDSGSGMPPEVLARIFDPLFSTKAQGRGTGLGLFMVRELALRWGGGVDVDSTPGLGSRFLLYLPAAASPPVVEGEPLPDPTPITPVSPRRVLVVDDDASMRLILAHLLEHYGFRAEEAGDGVQALALLDAGMPCDLVLSDIVMPRMDGIELHRRLARAYPRLPVILMTADEHQSVEAAGLPVGTEILFKPLAHRMLLSKILERLPGPS